MADSYGGTVIPVPVPLQAGSFPLEQVAGDVLLGYFANFLAKIIQFYAGDVWQAVHPAQPIVKTVIADEPVNGFSEAQLPCLYVYRPGRETREAIEKFEQVADDYRFQISRIEVHWIMNPVQQANHRRRNQIVDAVRKVIDRALHVGRDVAWIVPGDTDVFLPDGTTPNPQYDPKAATQGSSLLGYTGAAVLELEHASPGKYDQKMMLPAPQRHYDELRMSFTVEELLERDITLLGDPNTTAQAGYVSPDQGTGLGPFDLGDAYYQ